MRKLVAVVLFVCLTGVVFVGAAAPAQAQPWQKVCSPVVPDRWRAALVVLPEWRFADCQAYARSIGATAIQVGCFNASAILHEAPYEWAPVNRQPLPGTSNCGWPNARSSLRGPVSYKVCSAYVPDHWNSLTITPTSWTPEDCQEWARAMRATHVKLGCLLSDLVAGPTRFSWSSRHAGVNTPITMQVPATDCGWRSGRARPAMPSTSLKVCSAYVSGAWRSATVVPIGWQPNSCLSWARSIGATRVQLACIYETAPAGSPNKQVIGTLVPVATGRWSEGTIPPDCGWG
jgi:hypothetical protein